MAEDQQIRSHKEWLGYVQPLGLVVSIPALEAAQAQLDRNFRPQHELLLAALAAEGAAQITPLPRFLHQALEWDLSLLNGAPGAPPLPDELTAPLEAYGETLRPTYALRDYGSEHDWLLLIERLPAGQGFDDNGAASAPVPARPGRLASLSLAQAAFAAASKHHVAT